MIYISNELSHHGVKGMKWGIRKEKYSKEQISQRRKELVAQAPSSNGKRRSAGSAPTKGYWKNASDAQIRRLMESEAKEKKKAAKKSYKDTDKQIRQWESDEYDKYRSHLKKTSDIHSQITKSAKDSYKSGRIDKDTYKKIKRASRSEMYNSDRAAEYRMAIGQYQLQKARKANRLIYLEDVYGKEHKKYEKGKKALQAQTEYWSTGNSTYAVSKGSDGKYKVTRTDVYVY